MTEQTALSEHDAKRLLADHGVAVTDERLVDTADEAAAAAAEVGWPCVVKLCGETILHKTEIGGVRLGLADAEAVRAAATDLLEKAPGARLLVAEQVRGSRELIAGVTDDPQFGPTLMFGVGGIFAEVLGDVVFRLLPATRDEIASMLDDLRTTGLLGEFRGEPEVDREALVDTLVGIAAAAEARDDIEAIDVNPLIVTAGRPVAVDALVVLR